MEKALLGNEQNAASFGKDLLGKIAGMSKANGRALAKAGRRIGKEAALDEAGMARSEDQIEQK